jgi:PST family polysaccharide transporter
MGVSNSGVRQIAEAAGSSDPALIARTAVVLRQVAIALAIVALVTLTAFSKAVSILTFGTGQHAAAVALLALAVALRLLADGESALVQGMRRIADLARINVTGALYGTLAAIPVVYFLREDGIVLSIVALGAASAIAAWWYGRKVRIQRCVVRLPQLRRESLSLLKLGMAFMASGLLMMGAAYAVRVIVASELGLDSAGFYQAAWTLGGLYIGFVLQAMGTDFYPRLVAVVHNPARCNQLVNEQAQVSMLLAAPGVVGTVALAPIAISLFYSDAFAPAVDVLRWICMGMALRVITWPMGFIIVAQNRQVVFFLTELAWTVVSVTLAWACVQRFGLAGAGVAFFASYIFHGCMIYPLVRRATGFRWSGPNKRAALYFTASAAVAFYAFYLLPPVPAAIAGILATVVSAVCSARSLLGLVEADRLPRLLRMAHRFFGARPLQP